ncbi:MAG: flagellar biosynthesis protein FlgC [Rhodospirillaceae bacterium]|nr:flagellar biosynthesis protein FlgC [Rhodospirillaceae bacterium]
MRYHAPVSSIPISVSGLTASAARLAASASNVANARTRGPVPQTPATTPPPVDQKDKPEVYRAIDTVQTSTREGANVGGTRATYRTRQPEFVQEYDPSSPLANDDGLVAAPNVDPAGEIVEQKQAEGAYKANLKAVQVADDMMKSLLDIKA